MITTEKDAVRIPDDFKPVIPLYYLRMEIEIVEGYDDFEEAVSSICELRPINSKVLKQASAISVIQD